MHGGTGLQGMQGLFWSSARQTATPTKARRQRVVAGCISVHVFCVVESPRKPGGK